MQMTVSIVIPSMNEDARIARSIQSAWDSGAAEVIVSDGGSSDETLRIARQSNATIAESETPRARQMNAGFEKSTGSIVCFLHADTTLPPDACQAMSEAVSGGAEFGGFRVGFAEPGLRLSYVAFMINARTARTLCPWGDQAQFFERKAFEDVGRYPEMPIMEDYEIARRMKRRRRPILLSQRVSTSGRRFLERGVVVTSILNWRIILSYHLGVSPEKLRTLYGAR